MKTAPVQEAASLSGPPPSAATAPAEAAPAAPVQAAPPAQRDEGALRLLLVGVDEGGHRTDMIAIVHWKPGADRLQLVSLPRDTKVAIPCPPGHQTCLSPDKLGHAHAYGGPELLVQTLEGFLGVQIDYWVRIDFVGFESLIDTIGGVTLEVEPGLEEVKLYPGRHRLNGAQALRYVRFRNHGSDIDRIRRTQAFLTAVLADLEQIGPGQLPGLLMAAHRLISTNLLPAQALSLAMRWLASPPQTIEMTSLPGRSVYERELWFWETSAQQVQAVVSRYLKERVWEEQVPSIIKPTA